MRSSFRSAGSAILAAAALALSFAAGAAAQDAQLIERVEPVFPREALQAGTDRGPVKARMILDGSGAVTRVEILEAAPRRVFDRAVVHSLSQWKFNGGSAGRAVETEVVFRR